MINQPPCITWAEKLALRREDLAPAERAALDAHLLTCPACAAAQAGYHFLDARLRALPLPALKPLPRLSLQGLGQEKGDKDAEEIMKAGGRCVIAVRKSLPAALIVRLMLAALVLFGMQSASSNTSQSPGMTLFTYDATAAGFRRAGMPVVLIDAYHPLLTSLVVNNVDGAYQAVKCLIEHGHRRIGFINGITEGDFSFNPGNERFVGLRRALDEAGVLYEPDLVLTAEWDRQGGRQAALQLLTRPDRPTAISAASDMQAVGVLEAARSLNISVPADLSVIGFDGIELAEIMELSTVQQPMQHMGELGAQKLIAQIEGTADAWSLPELVRLQTRLVLRRTITTPQPIGDVTPPQEAYEE